MKKFFAILFILCFSLGQVQFLVSAQTADDADMINIRNDIEDKQAEINQLNQKIEEYKKKIAQKQKEAVNLQNQVGLLENRIAKTELDISAAEVEIDLVNAQLNELALQIEDTEGKLARNRQIMSDVLRKIENSDRAGNLEWIFGSRSLGDVMSNLANLGILSKDLQRVLDEAKKNREEIVNISTKQEAKKGERSANL